MLTSSASAASRPRRSAPASARRAAMTAELAFAVARAHHRWLADLCSTNPDRRLGIATVPVIHDVPTGVEEIERAYDSGVRGGVMIPSQWAPMPTYNDPIYDPIWAACQERDMVVAIHSGGTPRDVTMSSGMIPIFATEAWFFAGAPAVAADLKRRVRTLPGPEAGDHVERRLPGAGHVTMMDEAWVGTHSTLSSVPRRAVGDA
jgi:predicted TIM-barrel fold metal-dependent hydrolase